MLVKPPISDRRIIDCLHTHYGIHVVTLTVLPLGADMNASVYKAETRNQPSYFIKLKHGHHHDIGLAILGLLHDAGLQQIIPPIKTIHSQTTQRIDDSTLIVHPFIEGQNGFSRPLTSEQWLILGKTLRQIHEIDIPLFIRRQLKKESYTPKWRKIVRSLYSHIEAKPIDDAIALQLLAFMRKNMPIIRRLVDRSEQLAKILQNEPPKSVLCHADIHGGNVLMDSTNAIYIVDWDDPIMAPKERDLMFIGGGVANVWNKSHEEALFYKGYGKTKVNKTVLAYYRHERIVEDIALYGQNLLLTMGENDNRQEMYKHFVAMFEPKGVVDIAFHTDADFTLRND